MKDVPFCNIDIKAPEVIVPEVSKFFKDLTSGSMQIDGTDNIPFSLFISAQRRRKILNAMWSSDDQSKKEGEKILGNYKKQLAEKAAREHIDS